MFKIVSAWDSNYYFCAVFFYSYGHFYSIFEEKSIFGFAICRHRYIAPLLFLLSLFIIILIIKNTKNYSSIFHKTNLVIGTMLCLTIIQISILEITKNNNPKKPFDIVLSTGSCIESNSTSSSTLETKTLSNIATRHETPDVYYIVLDAYSRYDRLMEKGYDNSYFEEELKDRGFVIPLCGESNYNWTILSVGSTLNLDYWNTLGILESNLSYKTMKTMLEPYLKDSIVREKFHKYGYKFVTSQVIYPFLDIQDSDIYYKEKFATEYVSQEYIETMRFQELFVESTFLRVLSEIVQANTKVKNQLPEPLLLLIHPLGLNLDTDVYGGKYYINYQINKSTLDFLEESVNIPGRKFVYSHLLVTHTPYVFSENGDFTDSNALSQKGYQIQLTYLNERIINIVDKILVESKSPPIIILQADHSDMLDGITNNKNFQAYYFPGVKEIDFDKNFSNVNTFRFVFSRFFNEPYELLPNHVFFYDFKDPVIFQEIEPDCP